MKQAFYIFIISIFLISCKSEVVETKHFYDSGNLKELHISASGKQNKIVYYYDNAKSNIKMEKFLKPDYDSLIYYYENGNIFKKGTEDKDNQRFGIWNYYTKEGYLSNSREYFIVNNSWRTGSWLNQSIYFNSKGDTIFYGNNKFNIYDQKDFRKESEGEKSSIFVRFHKNVADTISIAESFSGIAEDGAPFWKSKNSESFIVLAKENYNFNKDFSNEAQVKLDTFYCLEKDKNNRGILLEADQKHTVIFGRWFDTPGEKILRGYMVERYKRKSTETDSITGEARRTYFEKRIFVKDTLK